MTLTIPFGDIVGRANYTYAKLDLEQAQARLKIQDQQIYLEVSDAVRTLETAAKSVDAYRIARELAERQLEAEMKKLNVGMSTNYFVLTYQDALATRPVDGDEGPGRLQHRRGRHRQGDRTRPSRPATSALGEYIK